MRLEEEFGYLMFIGFPLVVIIAILGVCSLRSRLKKTEIVIFLAYMACQIVEFVFLNCLLFDPGEGSDSVNLGMIGIVWAVGVFLVVALLSMRKR